MALVLALAAPLVDLAAQTSALRAMEILRVNCLSCHSRTAAMSGLDLTTRDSAFKGGSRGPAIVAGNPAASRLATAVRRKGGLAMPPTKALDEAEAAALEQWIAEGAAWEENAAAAPVSNWWSFAKPVRPTVPKSGDPWVRNEIDEFVLEKLRAAGLTPSAAASPEVLARRAYYDLWGLPPRWEQATANLPWKDLVEQLLASPHYGEKWGRHWLELVRYSDTAGFELDSYIHDAWRYRDWVIDAFNADKPYDRFVREQIAADELFPEDPAARTGGGLYCVGPNRDLFPDQADINREEILTDYVDTTSAVFLGMTAGCARCHDHKFDPISQEDYYRVRAVFAPAVKTKVALDRLPSLGFDVAESVREWKLREFGEGIRAAQARCQDELRSSKLGRIPAEAREALTRTDPERTQRQRELATQYGGADRVTEEEVRACMTPAEAGRLREIEKALVRMYSGYRAKPFACGLADSWNVAPRTFLPSRGSRTEREVQPGFFSILGGGEVPPPAEKREATGPIPLMPTTGRRTALAGWIANAENPLTARVIANRVWQYHFGRGLAATPSDLGARGGKPSHPELLDWLALELVSHGWSIKHLHRIVMDSATYRQSANPSKEAAARDPGNLLLSRFSRRRINADELRDSVLLATGGLNPKRGGRPVVPPLAKEEKENLTQRPDDAWVVTADQSEHSRRSVYLIQKRTFRLPMMEVFDAPDSMLSCPRRESSTTAPQALTLLNGSLTMERARAMASGLAAEFPAGAEAIEAVWRRVLARRPGGADRQETASFVAALERQTEGRVEALAQLIRALLNTNEFLYVD